jgi:hypothetical protein
MHDVLVVVGIISCEDSRIDVRSGPLSGPFLLDFEAVVVTVALEVGFQGEGGLL